MWRRLRAVAHATCVMDGLRIAACRPFLIGSTLTSDRDGQGAVCKGGLWAHIILRAPAAARRYIWYRAPAERRRQGRRRQGRRPR